MIDAGWAVADAHDVVVGRRVELRGINLAIGQAELAFWTDGWHDVHVHTRFARDN
ncbi:MAG: hypothetical protein KY460_02225 [Actinobacteria bacterium]|nr:hypothetical protein [Actinomycetota bacterium]